MSKQFILPTSSRADRAHRIHTPTTFRAQRRLAFRTPATPSISTAVLGPPGVSPPSSPRLTPAPRILPWETAGNSRTTSLFKTSPPNLTYPAGSIDERTNKRFLKEMDMFLFSNFQVRAVLVGQRPHPFSDYERLKQFCGQPTVSATGVLTPLLLFLCFKQSKIKVATNFTKN